MIQNQFNNSVWLTRKAAAAYLGLSVSTLANWASTKAVALPYYGAGRSVRYKKSDLDDFVENGKVI